VEPLAETVLGHHLDAPGGGALIPAETAAAEDRVVGQHGGGGAQRGAVAEVGFASVVPSPAVMRLLQPGGAVGSRLEAATGGTVIPTARIPVAEIGVGRAGIHQRPRAEVRCITEPQIGSGVGSEVERVVEHRPTAHLRHVG